MMLATNQFDAGSVLFWINFSQHTFEQGLAEGSTGLWSISLKQMTMTSLLWFSAIPGEGRGGVSFVATQNNSFGFFWLHLCSLDFCPLPAPSLAFSHGPPTPTSALLPMPVPGFALSFHHHTFDLLKYNSKLDSAASVVLHLYKKDHKKNHFNTLHFISYALLQILMHRNMFHRD